jgi:drug/metabolite transporter (DMT)-like permease
MMKSKTSSSSSSSSSPYTSTQHLLLFFQILTTCSLSLLTQFTLKQNTSDPTNRKFAYNSLTVPFFAEFGKLALSLALFYWNDATKKTNFSMSDLDVSRGTLAMAAIPASLYAVSNNLNFFVIADLGAFSYQMLNQLKIVCTAIAFKVIMRKHLTKLQWRMMVLLTVGCMVSQLGAKEGGSAEQVRFAEDRHIFAGATNRRIVPAYPSAAAAALAGDRPSGTGDVSGGAYYANEDERTRRRMLLLASSFSDYGRLTQGYVLESFAIVTSSLAGVFVEMFLKNTKNPFYFQNALLYGWGTMITFASLVWDTNFFENGVHHELFRGHTLVSLLLVANSAFGGIATSAVMKYLDVIAKTFATTVSLFIVAFVSIAYLGETVRPELFLGAIVAAIAIEGYYHGLGLIDEDPNLVESVGVVVGGVELKNDFTLGEEDDEDVEMNTSDSKVV